MENPSTQVITRLQTSNHGHVKLYFNIADLHWVVRFIFIILCLPASMFSSSLFPEESCKDIHILIFKKASLLGKELPITLMYLH